MRPGFAAAFDRALGSFRDNPVLAVVSYGTIRNLTCQILQTYKAGLFPQEKLALEAFARDMANQSAGRFFASTPVKPMTLEQRSYFLSLEQPDG